MVDDGDDDDLSGFLLYMAYSSRCTHIWCGVCICGLTQSPCISKPVYLLFMSSMSGIIFNQSASAITDDSQSGKDIDSYFKSQLCGGPRPTKAGTQFTELTE